LSNRVQCRVSASDAEDLLPLVSVDLLGLSDKQISPMTQDPDSTRADMINQQQILRYHFRGQTELALLNALTISYLRRDTKHTKKARELFHRIWEECGALLVNQLTTRWLISTLQTFFDHGKNENQRLIGGSGYFYGNMMKIYEGERALEGLPADQIYPYVEPQTKNKFRGLDRFQVGGTDLHVNTNALLLEVSQRDRAAGLVAQELLLRTKNADTVFSRMDRTRIDRGIQIKNFENTWSFFDDPS
jgi:hypothetical protein